MTEIGLFLLGASAGQAFGAIMQITYGHYRTKSKRAKERAEISQKVFIDNQIRSYLDRNGLGKDFTLTALAEIAEPTRKRIQRERLRELRKQAKKPRIVVDTEVPKFWGM